MNFETWLQSDLTKPLKVQALHGVFFSADNAANLIGVEVFNNGTAASLSGTCIGYAIRADGGTVPITGTVSGNKASIILPTSAYVIEGPLDIVIKVVSGSVKTTVGACHGYVQRATTDTIIDPGHVIPSLEELLALIEPMEEATDAANAAAASANTAATNANSKATAANTAATNANEKATLANTAATNANTARDNANTAAAAANAAAAAAPTQITNQATAYQNSTSGTTIPTGTWLDTQPATPQGQYLWIRKTLTWNNNQTTTLYSVSRMGIDGSGSVVSVNDISPDANGNVTLPTDTTPTQNSTNYVTSGGVHNAIDILHTNNAGFHNSIFRGRNLGSSVTDAQWNAIAAGTFDDLFIGDYWINGNETYRIAGFNYWINTGDTLCNTPHVVIVPDAWLVGADGSTTHLMNSTSTTIGGYVGSDFYTGNNGNTAKSQCMSKINNAFGAAHILSHREFLTNGITGECATSAAWYDSTIELLNERMVWGNKIYGHIFNSGTLAEEHSIDNSQLPLFALNKTFAHTRADWWLRDIVSSQDFSYVGWDGLGSYAEASNPWIGIRTVFAICAEQ